MVFTDYDGNRLGDAADPPDWGVWVAESSYELDGEPATYCRDGRVPLPSGGGADAPEPPDDYISIEDIAGAVADASAAVSANAEDLSTLADALAELSALVSGLSEKEASDG